MIAWESRHIIYGATIFLRRKNMKRKKGVTFKEGPNKPDIEEGIKVLIKNHLNDSCN